MIDIVLIARDTVVEKTDKILSLLGAPGWLSC